MFLLVKALQSATMIELQGLIGVANTLFSGCAGADVYLNIVLLKLRPVIYDP